MSLSLPERPSLEHLKSQAKDLLTAYRAGDADAKRRIHLFFPTTTPIGLSETQLALAREYGFDSWARLKVQVTLLADGPGLTERANRLAELAIWGS